jgi:beta-xylosidase
LGLARSQPGVIDAPWETHAGNPILADLPGNIGLGHADLLVLEGVTYLYTSLNGERRSRLRLVWND